MQSYIKNIPQGKTEGENKTKANRATKEDLIRSDNGLDTTVYFKKANGWAMIEDPLWDERTF